MTERQREDAVLAELESLRKRLHQIVDQRTDQLFLTILLGDRMAPLPEGEVLCPFARDPAAFKGMRPTAVILPDGAQAAASTWREAATVILRHCAGDPLRREKLMALRDNVSGNFRCLISASPDGMRLPLEISRELYVEGNFDTEALLRNLTEKLLIPAGYDYRRILLQCRAPQQEMHETTGITSVPEEMPDHGPTMTL